MCLTSSSMVWEWFLQSQGPRFFLLGDFLTHGSLPLQGVSLWREDLWCHRCPVGPVGVFLDGALSFYFSGKSYFFLFMVLSGMPCFWVCQIWGLFDGLVVSSDGSIHSIGWLFFCIRSFFFDRGRL